MNSSDYLLSVNYKNICGLNNIISSNILNSTFFLGSTTINSNLNISNTSIFQNMVLINSNLTTLKNTILNNTYLNNDLFISGTSIINKLTCYSNLYGTHNMFINSNLITQNALYNNLTLISSLNVSDVCTLSNGLFVNNISASFNDNLTINGNIINIGNSNSIVDIIGTTIYISNSEFELKNKIITLNSSSNFSALDIGNLCGIQIYGNNNNMGFLCTNTTGNRFEIKTPLDITTNYIALIDNNYNLIISGSTILQDNVSICSNLYVSSNTIFNNLLVDSNFIISRNTILNNIYSNSINVSSNSLFNGALNIYNLNISGFTIINNDSTFNSCLNLNNSIFGNCSILSSINISSNVILNNSVSINTNLSLNNNIIKGSVTVESQLNILNNSLINQSTFLSNLNILGNTNINNAIVSSLNVNGTTNISGNITFGSNLNTNLNIILPLAEYVDNINAANAGVPLWGFYRTGDIVKICVNSKPPVINLKGTAIINIILNTEYIEPGLIITDSLGEIITGYIISINDGTTEYITTPIPVIGTDILIQNSLNFTNVSNRTVTITYTATNSYNNIATITRIIKIGNIKAFDVKHGSFEPIIRNFTVMNNTDWTCEIWIYMTSYNSDYLPIFDFEDYPERALTTGARQGTFCLCILPITNTLGFFGYANNDPNYKFNFSDLAVPLNKWCHIIWMRKNNNLYGIINGKSSIARSTDVTPYNCFNNLINIKNLLIVLDTYKLSQQGALGTLNDQYGGGQRVISFRKFQGYIRHPLIRLGSYYDPNIDFSPSSDLTPVINSSLLFFLDMDMNELVWNSILNKIQTVDYYIIPNNIRAPVVILNGDSKIRNSNISIEIYSNYIELGATCFDLNNNIISNIIISGFVDTYKLGSYIITYTGTDKYGISGSITRTVNVSIFIYTLGLECTLYDGYWNKNIDFFKTASLYLSSETSKLISVNFSDMHTALNNTVNLNVITSIGWLTSIEWLGYFYASQTGIYTFTINLNDLFYMWIGSDAISNYNSSNSFISKSIISGQNISNTISLESNKYYYIRMQYTYTGFSINIKLPNNSTITNTTGYFYYKKPQNFGNLLPIITLVGASTIYIKLNSLFVDPGVTGTDCLGINISTYTVSTIINTTVVGKNILTYTITDQYGISNTINRTIYVIDYINLPLNDIFFWIDASDNSKISISNDNIIEINDKSSNNIKMIPSYGTTKILGNGINNLSTISIDNSGFISNNTYANSSNFTFAIVITIFYSDPNWGWGLIFGHYPDSNWDAALQFRIISGSNNVGVGNNNITIATINNVPVLFLVTRTNTEVTLTMINLINGIRISATPRTPTSVTLGNYKFSIGKFINVINEKGKFNIGEIMYWKRVLTTVEQNITILYLTSKWSYNIATPNTLNIIPIISLNGYNNIIILVNEIYTELGVTGTDFLGNNITNYTITGSVNTLVIGQYILTYLITDNYNNNNSITRTVNIVSANNNISIAYETYNGNLQISSGLNLNALSQVDWTCEIWVYMNADNNGTAIFDFRKPNNMKYPPNHFFCEIYQSKPCIVALDQGRSGNNITKSIVINQWTHVVWMRYNNKLYTFINGFASPANNIPTYLNSLSELEFMIHGVWSDWVNTNSTTYHFNGKLCQPLITLGAKYNITGFTPNWDLTPSNFSNVLYWLNNGIEVISGKNIIINRTVPQSIVNNPLKSSIKLIGLNQYYILINNTYTEYGAIAKDISSNSILYTILGSVNTSVSGQYILNYITNDNNLMNNIIRKVNIVTSLPKISYNLNNGYLGPLTSVISQINYTTLWTVDTTFEAWINVTQLGGVLVDFRNPIYTTNTIINSNSLALEITSTGLLSVYISNSANSTSINNTLIPLYQWTHVVIMRYNNNFYSFINGVASLPVSLSNINDLSRNTAISIGLGADYLINSSTQNPFTYKKFYGYIYQASIQLGAKYSINNFIPEDNLQPITFTSNNLFFLGINGNDLISNQNMSIVNVTSDPILPLIKLNGLKIMNILINNSYIELGVIATDSFMTTLVYTISGTVNTNVLGTYTITYTVINANGSSSIKRTINIITSYTTLYNMYSGYLGSLTNIKSNINYTTLWTVDTTFETMIYMTYYPNNGSGGTIIDFRNPNNSSDIINNYSCSIGVSTSGYLYIRYGNAAIQIIANTIISLNIWTHIVVMRYNNNFYTFINGKISLPVAATTNFLNLSNNTSISLGLSCDYIYNNATAFIYWKFYGDISQVSLQLGAKYNISNFTSPVANLQPQIFTSNYVFFLGSNNIDLISGQVMDNAKVTLTLGPPIISLINNNTLYIQLNSVYIENGIIATDYFKLSCVSYNISSSIDTSIPDTYTITYTATDLNKTQNSIQRRVIVYNTDTKLSSTAYNFKDGVIGRFIETDFTTIFKATNFTVEMWVYGFGFGNTSMQIHFVDPATIVYDDPVNNNRAIIYYPPIPWVGNQNKIAFGKNINKDAWMHIVWMLFNGSLYGFINGYHYYNYEFSISSSEGTNYKNLKSIIIGRYANNLTSHNGVYTSQMLISSNAKYSKYINTSFVPESDLSVYKNDPNTKFLLGDNFTENITNTIIPSKYNVVTTNRYFSYIESYSFGELYDIRDIKSPINTDWTTIFNNDFTFEVWILPGSIRFVVILDNSDVQPKINQIYFIILGDGTIGFCDYLFKQYKISTESLLVNQWSHVVWMRKNNFLYTFINGDFYPGYDLTSNNIVISNLKNISLCPNYNYYRPGITISQPLFTNYAKYNITQVFIPKIDLTPQYNDLSIIFFITNGLTVISTVNNPLPTIQQYIRTRTTENFNTRRNSLNNWATFYNGINTVLYEYIDLLSFTNASKWTFEGWIHCSGTSSAILMTTCNPFNYKTLGQIEFGYDSRTLWVSNTTTGIKYYSYNYMQTTKMYHFAFVMHKSKIFFYINGEYGGETPSFLLSNNTIILINTSANQITTGNGRTNGYYSQFALMTYAKYLNEFLPYYDLTPSTFTNYLLFLGADAKNLASGNNLNVYNNFAYKTKQMIIFI